MYRMQEVFTASVVPVPPQPFDNVNNAELTVMSPNVIVSVPTLRRNTCCRLLLLAATVPKSRGAGEITNSVLAAATPVPVRLTPWLGALELAMVIVPVRAPTALGLNAA